MTISNSDLCWLAGYLEGEGSFSCGPPSKPGQPVISVSSTDEDIIARVALLWGVNYSEAKRKKKNPKHKLAWTVQKRSYPAVQLMLLLRPIMSNRRQQAIDKAVASYLKHGTKRRLLPEEVETIRAMCKTVMSQKEIGKQFGVSRETVNKIKNGKFHSYKEP
jgi:DNA-binding XRE family transcriptional regulator